MAQPCAGARLSTRQTPWASRLTRRKYRQCLTASTCGGGMGQGRLHIPAATRAQVEAQAQIARERADRTLLQEAGQQQDFTAEAYLRRLLMEVSKPRNAVEILLPLLYKSYRG